MSGRDLSSSLSKQVESNQKVSKPNLTDKVQRSKDKEGQKKEGMSVSLKHQNITDINEFLREFNYQNKSKISFSGTLDALIELSLNSQELKKELLKKT